MWISLAVFCGFVMWDTQMIILKKRRGDGDFIGHSLELFIDFVQIVKNIIVLLINKVSSKTFSQVSWKESGSWKIYLQFYSLLIMYHFYL